MFSPDSSRGPVERPQDQSNALTQNKIQINFETGRIKLPNGKTYKVKITTSAGTRVLEKDQQEITKLVIDLLNRSQEEEKFTFIDLSHTKITHEGISTDQGKVVSKPLNERVITPLNFDQSFREITRLATGILSKGVFAAKDTHGKSLMEEQSSPSEEERTHAQTVVPAKEKHVHWNLPEDKKPHANGQIPIISEDEEYFIPRKMPSVMNPISEETHPKQTVDPFAEEDSYEELFVRREMPSNVNPQSGRFGQQPDQSDESQSSGLFEHSNTDEYSDSLIFEPRETDYMSSDDGKSNLHLPGDIPKLMKTEEELTKAKDSSFEISFTTEANRSKKEPKYRPMEKSFGEKVGDAFSYAGKKMSKAWKSIGDKVENLFEDKKDDITGKKDEIITSRESLEDWNQSLRQGEIQLFFEEVHESELEMPKIHSSIDWKAVSMAEVTHMLNMASTTNSKLRIIDGKLALKKREMNVLKSNVGTSPESKEIITNILGKVRFNLVDCSVNLPQEELINRQQILAVTEMMNKTRETMDALKQNGWANTVLEQNESLAEEMQVLTNELKKLEQVLTSIKESDQWKFIDNTNLNTILINSSEKKFREDYLRNYRLYTTSEDLIESQVQNFQLYGQWIEGVTNMEPDEKGNVTLEMENGVVTHDKDETIDSLKQLQQGALLICIQWLEDPFINNGDHLKSDDIQELLVNLVEETEKAAHIPLEVKNAIFDLVNDKTSQSEPVSLITKKMIGTTNNASYADRLLLLSQGSLNPDQRAELLEEMSEDIYKLNSYSYSQLSSREFAHQAWVKDNKEENSPNLVQMRDNINQLTNFIHFSIIGMTSVDGSTDDPMLRNRAQMIEFFIDLADKAVEKNDFQQAMIVYAALNQAGIGRLKKTWEQVSDDHKTKNEEMQALCDPEKSYHNLRSKIAEVKEKEGVVYIPFMGMFLTDYTMLEEGNQLRTKEDPPKTVATTLEMFGNLLREVAIVRERILEKQDKKMLTVNRDLSKELGDFNKNIPDILTKILSERGNLIRVGAMSQGFNEQKKFDDIMYNESLAIEPRAK